MVSAFALTIVMDKIIYGAGSGKLVLVITNEGAAVAKAINDAGGAGQHPGGRDRQLLRPCRQMVMCACSNNEVFKVRLRPTGGPRRAGDDREASEVFGEGFRAPEVNEKSG